MSARRWLWLVLAVVGSAAVPATALAGPKAGDWEARGSGGALASFALGRAGGGLAVSDLVVQAPISCANAFGSPNPVDVELIPGTARLGRAHAFASGAAIRPGHSGTSITAAFRHGVYALTYRHVAVTINAFEGGEQTCDTGKIHLTARPGRRPALKDGLYEGQSAESEQIELNLVAGGRALESSDETGPGGVAENAFSLSGANSSDACGYTVTSALFVGPSGSFSNAAERQGDEAVLSGRFSRDRISGEFSNEEESCGEENWSASWRFH